MIVATPRIVVVLAVLMLATGSNNQVALACRYGSGSEYPDDSVGFKVGQASQGGNIYYGVAGTVRHTSPPDPRDASHPDEHVSAQLGSADDRFQAAEQRTVYVGWFVGNNIANNPRATPHVFAEFFNWDGTSNFVVSVAAPSEGSYMSQLGAQVGANWEYRAYRLDGGWSLIGTGVLATSTTRQDAFGEASDPSEPPESFCKRLSAVGLYNRMSSLQLFVDAVQWQNWEPAFGRFANPRSDYPYVRSTVREFTDLDVGGP